MRSALSAERFAKLRIEVSFDPKQLIFVSTAIRRAPQRHAPPCGPSLWSAAHLLALSAVVNGDVQRCCGVGRVKTAVAFFRRRGQGRAAKPPEHHRMQVAALALRSLQNSRRP